MSNNINIVVLGGHLTRDVDLRFSEDGYPFATVGLAINMRVKRGEEWLDEPCFVDVKLSGKRAEAFAKYHSKGDPALFPRAELKLESWVDKASGGNRTKLVVKAHDWEFVGGKRDGALTEQVAENSGDTPF